jgi:hypothetical protein
MKAVTSEDSSRVYWMPRALCSTSLYMWRKTEALQKGTEEGVCRKITRLEST